MRPAKGVAALAPPQPPDTYDPEHFFTRFRASRHPKSYTGIAFDCVAGLRGDTFAKSLRTKVACRR